MNQFQQLGKGSQDFNYKSPIFLSPNSSQQELFSERIGVNSNNNNNEETNSQLVLKINSLVGELDELNKICEDLLKENSSLKTKYKKLKDKFINYINEENAYQEQEKSLNTNHDINMQIDYQNLRGENNNLKVKLKQYEEELAYFQGQQNNQEFGTNDQKSNQQQNKLIFQLKEQINKLEMELYSLKVNQNCQNIQKELKQIESDNKENSLNTTFNQNQCDQINNLYHLDASQNSPKQQQQLSNLASYNRSFINQNNNQANQYNNTTQIIRQKDCMYESLFKTPRQMKMDPQTAAKYARSSSTKNSTQFKNIIKSKTPTKKQNWK